VHLNVPLIEQTDGTSSTKCLSMLSLWEHAQAGYEVRIADHAGSFRKVTDG
jgi:hypothetical protein